MNDSVFYVTAVFIPVLFVLVGSAIRFIIKRKVEWELCYFGIELVLAGFASVLIHLFNPPADKATPALVPTFAQGAAKAALLTKSQDANTQSILSALVSAPSQWSYSGRCGISTAILFFALIMLVVLHIMFEIQQKPLSKYKKSAEVFFLFVVADLIGGGAMVYMERLLR